MKTICGQMKNKKAGPFFKIGFSIPLLLSLGFILYFFMKVFINPIDNATIQVTKIEFSKGISDDKVAAIIKLVKETQGIKTVTYFPQTTALVASFDNRVLSATDVEDKINISYPGGVKIISHKDYPNARGCPLHKSKLLSYIFNFF